MQREEVSLASADCRGFLFLGQERERLNAEIAEVRAPFAKGARGQAELAGFRRGRLGMKRFVLLGLAAVCGAMVAAAAGSQHTVSVTLNYDFSVDNACSSSVTTGCVKQFNIYDITGGGTPVKLFSIAAPGGANSAGSGKL